MSKLDVSNKPLAFDVDELAKRFGEHITRVIERHIDKDGLPVEDARNQFSVLFNQALEGKCQLIGKRRHAVVLSIEQLGEMMKEAAMPMTWGEAFEPTAELPGIEEPLEIRQDRAPRPRFLARLPSVVDEVQEESTGRNATL